MSVTALAYRHDDRVLSITVSNQAPVATASVLFLGVNAADSIRLSDDQGRQYRYSAASTGMRRQGANILGAGVSTFEFVGIDPHSATVDALGRILQRLASWSMGT